MIEINEITTYSDKVKTTFDKLIPQLGADLETPSQAFMEDLIKSENTHLFFAEQEDKVLGMLTVCTYIIPTGSRAWIEDVVVDSDARGLGIGKQLTQNAIDFCKANGLGSINLTSRPSRQAANLLYQKLGFKKRETNVYKFG